MLDYIDGFQLVTPVEIGQSMSLPVGILASPKQAISGSVTSNTSTQSETRSKGPVTDVRRNCHN